MKNLKIFFAAFAICMAIFAIYSCEKQDTIEKQVSLPKSKAISSTGTPKVGNSCFQLDDVTVGSCLPAIVPVVLELPQYPGCYFFINTNYYICDDGTTTAIYIGDFEIYDYVCDTYRQDLLNAINNGTIEQFELTFNSSVWAALTQNILDTAPSFTSTVLTIEYIIASCNQTCYYESEPDPKGMSSIIPVKTACGSQCCKRTTSYRRTEEGGWIVERTTYSTDSPNCSDNANACPGALYSTSCVGGCGALLGF